MYVVYIAAVLSTSSSFFDLESDRESPSEEQSTLRDRPHLGVMRDVRPETRKVDRSLCSTAVSTAFVLVAPLVILVFHPRDLQVREIRASAGGRGGEVVRGVVRSPAATALRCHSGRWR